MNNTPGTFKQAVALVAYGITRHVMQPLTLWAFGAKHTGLSHNKDAPYYDVPGSRTLLHFQFAIEKAESWAAKLWRQNFRS